MSRVMLKICGVTRVEDALFCANAGVDFVGVVFVPTSKRVVTECVAKDIAKVINGSTKLVGVFQNQPNDFVRRTAESLSLDYVQLHGNESDDDIAAIGFPVIKAVRDRKIAAASFLLYDAANAGSGTTFDWTTVPYERTTPIFLAGGINADNVMEAIRTVKPDGIDVSTGVEDAPGNKSRTKIRQLLDRIKTS